MRADARRQTAGTARATALILGLSTTVAAADAGGASVAADASLNLRASCGARGDGEADDSLALKTCLQRLQAKLDAGGPAVLDIPAGIYRITGANGPMPTLRGGAALLGQGPHQSHIVLDPSYAGDLFSWSEAWIGNNIGPPSYDVKHDKAGPEIIGLEITGSTAARNLQNAFVFYDRNDFVLMRDVTVSYLHGQCLVTGRTKAAPLAYVRESAFYNLMCWHTGLPDRAAIEISSTSGAGSDATNELDFFKLAVFAAAGDALQLRNPQPHSATRKIRFFGLRLEHAGRDGFVIGDPADSGQIAEISVHDLTVVEAGAAAIHVPRSRAARMPYLISVHGGALGPGNHVGISIETGRLIGIDVGFIDAAVIKAREVGPDVSVRAALGTPGH